jgi:long-chain acyl-CoA synthetase
VKDAFITSEQFSVENNTMTPTFKIKRREAFEKFEQEINFLYHTSQRKKSLKQFKNQ